MNGTAYDDMNNMMSGMQVPQSLSNFDDPSSLLTYLINDKDNSSTRAPQQNLSSGPLLDHHHHHHHHHHHTHPHPHSHQHQHQHQHQHSDLNLSQPLLEANNDHPYSRIERNHCLIPNNVPFVNNSSMPHHTLGLRLGSNIDDNLASTLAPNLHSYMHQTNIHTSNSSSIYSTNIMNPREPINETLSGFGQSIIDSNSNASLTNHSLDMTHIPEPSVSLSSSSKTEQNWMALSPNLPFSNSAQNQVNFDNVCETDKKDRQRQPNYQKEESSLRSLLSQKISNSSFQKTNVKPVVESVVEPIIEPIIEPIVDSSIEPVVESINIPITESTFKPAESGINPGVDQSNPTKATDKKIDEQSNSDSKELAELRTVIVFKIVDQIVHKGNIVKETILKDETYTKDCGTMPLHEALNHDSSFKVTFSQLSNEFHRASKTTEPKSLSHLTSSHGYSSYLNVDSKSSSKKISKGINKLESHSGRSKVSHTEARSVIHDNQSLLSSSSKRKTISSSSNTSKKGKMKVGEEIEAEIEKARQETATALLSLHDNKAIDSDDQVSIVESKNGPIAEKGRVFAQWNDKIFYPGTVASFQSDGKWLINFYDGAKKVVHESEIISVPYLTNGQTVMISLSNNYCAKGVIKRHFFEGDDIFYNIEYHTHMGKKTVKQCSPDDIFFTPELASTILGKQNKAPINASEFAGLDLNNIIPKRSRASKSMSTDISTYEALTSDSEVTSSKVSKPKKSQSASKWTKSDFPSFPDAVPAETKKKSPSSKQGSSVALTFETTQTISVNNNYRPVKQISSISKSLPCAEREKLLGPLPPNDSILFKGFGFLLSSTNTENDGEKAASEAGRSTPFDILYLINQIEMGSGLVFDSLEAARNSNEIDEIVLIAYTYQKSVLYLQCLAAGIPCVMHTWIIESCRCNQLLKRDSYLLPSGYSIINRNLPSDKNVFKKSANLFKGMKFMLCSQEILDIWTPILTTANATIISQLPSHNPNPSRKSSNLVDVIIADSSCPEAIIQKAEQLKIPIVSSEYIVQCLINGRKLPFDAHDKFNYTSIR